METLFPGTAHIQTLHPMIVHFPLAFLSGSVLVYFLAVILSRPNWEWTGFWLLALGAVSAVAAAYTGDSAADAAMLAAEVQNRVLQYHEWCMYTTMGLSLVLAAWALWKRPMPSGRLRVVFLAAILVMAAIMVKGADYGGWMVYGYNAGGDAAQQPIDWHNPSF